MSVSAATPRVTELAAHLASLKARHRELGLSIQQAEGDLIDAMDGEWEVEVEGLGVFKRRAGTKRTAWRHDDMWRAMGRLAQADRIVDPETGEVESVADSWSRHVVAACAPGYWRTTPLREWGIDPDEFCERTTGRSTIQIIGGEA